MSENHRETVAVVAADPIVRAGLTRLLSEAPGLDVALELPDLAGLPRPRPLVVLDLHDQPPAVPWQELRVVALVRPPHPP
ncbi:hypothetical protein AB0J83_42665, partial [Actinoplanes sp. NPDC049596]